MQTPKTHFVTSNCGKIAVWDTGGDRSTLVFLHGNSVCKEVFSRQFSDPSLSAYRLIAIDFPGHGESDNSSSPDQDYNICAFARVTSAVLKKLGLDKYLVYGSSMGGNVALEMAAQGAPICGIAMSGTPPVGPGGEAMAAVFSSLPHAALIGQAELTDEEIDTYLEHAAGAKESVPPIVKDSVKRTDHTMRPALINHWATLDEGTDQRSVIANWPNPIAVLQGERESFFDNDYLKELKWRNLWENKIHLLPDVGHAPFLETPSCFGDHLLRFAKHCFYRNT